MTTKHKQISEVVYWFYTSIVGYKPDATEYKVEYKRLERIMFPEDENLRGYTSEQIVNALSILDGEGIIMETLGILFYPHLLSAIDNGNAPLKKATLDRIKNNQVEKGLSPQQTREDKPDGW